MHPLRQELHQVWTTTCRAVCTGNEYPAVFRYIVQCLVRHRPEQTCLTCEQPGTVTHYQNDEPWQLLKHQCPIVLNIGLRLPADFCTDRVDQDAVTPHDRHRLSQLESSFSAMLKKTRGHPERVPAAGLLRSDSQRIINPHLIQEGSNSNELNEAGAPEAASQG